MTQTPVKRMKKIALFLIFSLLCLSVHGASLEYAFQLGEKQNPRLDKLLPNVASRITFNKDSTKLIAHEMGGSIVEWDIQKRQKRLVCAVEEDQWSAYTPRLNYLLIPKVDKGISVIDVANGNEIQLMKMVDGIRVVNIEDEINGQYTNGYFSHDSQIVALTEGDNKIEVWRFDAIGLIKIKSKNSKTVMTPWKISNFKTQLPVRNGIAISSGKSYVAASEGTYRDDEGHQTIVQVWADEDWTDSEKRPTHVFNTGEILGVWNLVFSDGSEMLAVDTQLNGKSGIRVWEIHTGRQLLNKSGFEAYWTRALAFAPINYNLTENEMHANLKTKGYLYMYYLASGDEKGNLRVWGIPYHTSKILETKSVIWETYPTGIQALAFSPNGEYLAIALWDTTIQILRWKKDAQ